jgi:hypothetical protein
VIYSKKCRKVISQIGKIFFFVILSQSKRKIVATSRASVTILSIQQNQVDKVVEEYSYIFSSPTGVPLHCQVKHPIDLTLGALLPNGLPLLSVRKQGDQEVDPRIAPQGEHPS